MKYADDVSAWVTDVDATLAARDLQNQLTGFSAWLNKWRLLVSAQKTEVVLFCKKGPPQPIHVSLNGNQLNQVPVKRSLGVDLDYHLKFDQHVDLVATRAIGAIAALHNLLNEAGGVRRDLAVNLYKAFILPHIEYAYSAWCTASRTTLSKLGRFQRIALIKATGCLNSTPTNSLEVISGCMPLNLRLKETLAQEYVRIMRKPDDSLIKQSLHQSLSHPFTPGIPMAAHLMQAAYRPTSRTIDIQKVETEPSLLTTFSSQITTRPITDRELGSSTNRTQEQILLAQSATTAHLSQLPPSTLIAFTDGSALHNPGPCGASAVIFTHGLSMQPTVLQRPVSKHSSSYHAELSAVHLALEYSSVLTQTNRHLNTICLHTDCQSVIATLMGGNPNGFHNTVEKIHELVRNLHMSGVSVEILWVAGHAGLAANEIADRAAKEAAKNAAEPDSIISTQVPLSEVKSQIRKETFLAWQRAWDIQHEGRFTYELLPKVKNSHLNYSISRKCDIRINRLRSGHSMLPEHASKMGLSSTNSPLCQCGRDTGTVAHFLLHCPIHTQAREALISSIELGYQTTNTPPHLRSLDIKTILGSNQDLSSDMRLCIHKATVGFLASCGTAL